jgi:hypothetical protein
LLVPHVTRFASETVPAALYEAYQPWLYAGSALLLGGIAAFWLGRQGRSVAAVWPWPSAVSAFGQGFLLGHDSLGSVNSAHDVAARNPRQAAAGSAVLFSVDTYDQSLQFYLKRTTTMVAYRDELGFGISQEPQKFIADIAGFESLGAALPLPGR